ncbi:MAG TPA: carbohydrate ABC transporter permease [Candidatus Avichristensenella intestinipullorum]|uniref:Carbohydrate ABC transporter permease n=1 Tax=Candidatus Avichristensenella intestinipullorum TaxID=2840693 RepID=A0A9D0YUT4_9FIRM|nr:carbohydrate ABC transporter permease [Candidatus Avichristensenella intestinipullorum]
MREGALAKYTKKTLMYLFLILASLLSIFPLYWSFISAFNNTQQILGGRMIPSVYLVQNIQNLFEQQDVFTALKNSFATSILQTVVALAVSSIAGYGFEIYHDKAKDSVMSILMLAMMVPFVAVLVPLFQMFTQAGLINSWIGFILPSISTPFLIMYFRNSARSFPRDTLEAARIDGLNEFQIFVRMFVPMMRPTYAAAATITFMNAWNAYLWPKVVMQTNESITMPMLVANLMGGYVIDFGVVMAGVTICSLPTIVIFFLLQKSFTNAVAGAVK